MKTKLYFGIIIAAVALAMIFGWGIPNAAAVACPPGEYLDPVDGCVPCEGSSHPGPECTDTGGGTTTGVEEDEDYDPEKAMGVYRVATTVDKEGGGLFLYCRPSATLEVWQLSQPPRMLVRTSLTVFFIQMNDLSTTSWRISNPSGDARSDFRSLDFRLDSGDWAGINFNLATCLSKARLPVNFGREKPCDRNALAAARDKVRLLQTQLDHSIRELEALKAQLPENINPYDFVSIALATKAEGLEESVNLMRSQLEEARSQVKLLEADCGE